MKPLTKKRFGQHFLNNSAIVERIIQQTHPRESDHFVEIGAGPGILTKHLIKQAIRQLDVIEIDTDLIPCLQLIQNRHPNLVIHHADILKFNIADLKKETEQLRLIGNLPYNISTPLIFHLLNNIDLITDMHFMVQKEVADRITAKVNTSQYGRLGIMVQYFCQAERLFDVSAREFSPPPKVTSTVIRLRPHQTPPAFCANIQILQDVVRTAFNQRRKMLSTSLKNLINREDFEQLAIAPTMRPENLTLVDFVKISNFIDEKTP